MKNVFISHSSKDKTIADVIVAALEQEGISVWIAPRDIPGGTDYGASIMKGLRECEVLVLVFSEASNTSKAVIREVQLAFNENKSIIPFRIEDVPVSDSMAFYLSGLHWVDAVQKENNVDLLLKDVKGILQNLGNEIKKSHTAPEQSHVPPPSHAKPFLSKKAVMTAAFALFLAVAGAFAFVNANREVEYPLVASSPTPVPTLAPMPTPTLAPAPTPTPIQAQLRTGDIIEFNGYDWLVLEVQENKALIITYRVIANRLYHNIFEAVTWETSEIRQWLNGDFFASFSSADQARITETYVVNNENPWDFLGWGGHANTQGGTNTVDRIFLLSIDEVLLYFGDSGLVAQGAAMSADARHASAYEELFVDRISDYYNQARRAWNIDGAASWWWLRSPGRSPGRAIIVRSYGALLVGGNNVFWEGGSFGIRPALWLYLE